jgi:hypothetical protein
MKALDRWMLMDADGRLVVSLHPTGARTNAIVVIRALIGGACQSETCAMVMAVQSYGQRECCVRADYAATTRVHPFDGSSCLLPFEAAIRGYRVVGIA